MENNKTERRPQISFPGTAELAAAAKEVKNKTGLTIGSFGREAMWEKIAEIRATHPAYEAERRAAMAHNQETAGVGV